MSGTEGSTYVSSVLPVGPEATPAPPQAATPAVLPTATPAAVAPAVNSANYTLIIFAAITGGMIMLVAAFLGYGEAFERKMQLFQACAFPCALIFGAALAASGYSTGKLFENAVPKGFAPAAGGAMAGIISQLVTKAVEQGNANTAANAATPIFTTAELKSSPATAGVVINTQSTTVAHADSVNQSPATTPSVLLALFIPALLFCGGCVSTSPIFQGAAKTGGDLFVADMKGYVASADYDANHNGVIDPTEASTKTADQVAADGLAAVIADTSKIEVEPFASAFAPVETSLRKHVAEDPTLADEDRKYRTEPLDVMEDVITKERERQASLWAKLGLGSK